MSYGNQSTIGGVTAVQAVNEKRGGGEIFEWLENLERTVEEGAILVEHVEARLEPILRMSLPMTTAGEKASPDAPLPAVASKTRGLVRQLVQQNERLRSVLDRIAL